MNFQDNIRRRQSASFGGVKIVTRDEHTCRKQLREGLQGDMLIWTCASGLQRMKPDFSVSTIEKDAKDPFDFVTSLTERFKKFKAQTVLVCCDLDHWLEEDPVLRRHFIEAVQKARTTGHLLVLMSRHSKAHPELTDEVTLVQHPLPGRDDNRDQLSELLKDNKVELGEEEMNVALDAVQGLTVSRQSDAFSLGAVDILRRRKAGEKEATLDVSVLRRYKEEEIEKLAFMKVSEPEKGFADLVGHDSFKDWLRKRKNGFTPEAREAALPVPRGMLLVGPPGTGKSRFAEATAKEWSYPFLTLDVGSLFGSMLGESEANADIAMEIAEKMSPCVLLVDEVERAFGGDKGSGDRDGGTTERVIGKFLTWMATKKEPVFVVFTSNEASSLPAQMIRKGRLDSIFFLDFPEEKERTEILEYYLKKGPYDMNEEQLKRLVEMTDNWAPAEIEAAVGDARYTAFERGEPLSYFDVKSEIQQAVPVSVSMSGQIDRMREWAREYARSTHSKPSWSGSAAALTRSIEV